MRFTTEWCEAPIIDGCARHARRLVITEMQASGLGGAPVVALGPSSESNVWDTWWDFSPDLLIQFVELLGFDEPAVSHPPNDFSAVEQSTRYRFSRSSPSVLYQIQGDLNRPRVDLRIALRRAARVRPRAPTAGPGTRVCFLRRRGDDVRCGGATVRQQPRKGRS